MLLRLITLDRRFDDVNAAGGDYAATTTLSSARWASATQTPRPPRRRDVGTDSERGGSGAHELLRTGAILSERVLIGIGLEKSNQIQGMFDLKFKFETNFVCFFLLLIYCRFGWDILVNFLDGDFSMCHYKRL